MNLSTGPSSWDRDMQGMPGMDEEESNLAALGMHVAGDDKKDDEEDDDIDVKIKDDVLPDDATSDSDDDKEEEDADDAKKDEEEVNALEELDLLAKQLKEEDAPAMEDIEE